MNGLEQAFYVIAIVFMAINFLLLVVLISSVLVIRSKINKIHDNIEHKLDSITSLAEKGGELSVLAKKAFKKAKR